MAGVIPYPAFCSFQPCTDSVVSPVRPPRVCNTLVFLNYNSAVSTHGIRISVRGCLAVNSGGALPYIRSVSNPDRYQNVIELRSSLVRLLDADKNMVGVVSKDKAIETAENVGLDLVILSLTSEPPVVRIVDYGKYKYLQEKKKRQQKGHTMDMKIVKLGYNIQIHDYNVRLKAAKKFLTSGDKVRVIVNLKGKGKFKNDAIKLLSRFQLDVGEIGLEEQKNLVDFNVNVTLLPRKGFRKIDSERWEFSNDDFVKGKKHLLRNIHRRKPIHSHSHPPGPIADSERAAFDEEIERLSHEKSCLETDILRSKQLCSSAKFEMEKVMLQAVRVEHRQDHILSILEKAVQNDLFLQHLALKLESMDFSAYNKKRRLPELPPNEEHPVGRGRNSSEKEQQPELFSTKLNLELSSTISNNNNNSNNNIVSDNCNVDVQQRVGCGTCSDPTQNGRKNGDPEICEGHTSCHLNLTLSSLPRQVAAAEKKGEEEEYEAEKKASTLTQPLSGGGVGRRGQVNDMFWEQFLTEKPGLSEEACSKFRENPEEEDDDKWSTTATNIRHLTL